ncbi:putative ankyrin repeat protein RF_0381 [Patella vulgata]|uniref:putative ankyrin repeat protein RF_0381 n=1 Tax=Patella vulgata TaxID=6465 RepID=UPI00217F4FEF|nr:putative ankyrin repeat protein RF_0381 [Patella vulgata]
MYTAYKKVCDEENKMELSLDDFSSRLKSAVKANDENGVKELMNQSIAPDAPVDKLKALKTACCVDALTNKNLPIVNLVFTKELVFDAGALNLYRNLEFMNAAIASDFVDGVQFLHSQGLLLEHLVGKPWNALYRCVEFNKVEVLKYLLTVPGIDLNPNKDEPLLTLSARHGHLGSLNVLLDSNVKRYINNKNKRDGLDALGCCIRYYKRSEHFDCLKALTNAGADFDAFLHNRTTPLLFAAEMDLPDVVLFLLQQGANRNPRVYGDHKLLHLLCKYSEKNPEVSRECVKNLIDFGADVNEPGGCGETPVLLAVIGRSVEILKELLKAGCDVNKPNGEPLRASIRQLSEDMTVEKIIIKMLLEAGADVNLFDEDGVTPLMVAAQQRNGELIELLISLGANVHACDLSGKSACHYSLERAYDDTMKSKELLEIFVKEGVSFATSNPDVILWHWIDPTPDIEFLKFLVNNGLEVHKIGSCEENLLHCLKHENFTEALMEYLLEIGVDINQQDKNGDTPLISAASDMKQDLLKYLVNIGCEVNTQNHQGQTALMVLGQDRHYLELLEILMKAGADINLRDVKGQTFFQYYTANNISYQFDYQHKELEFLLQNGCLPFIDIANQNGDTLFTKLFSDEDAFPMLWFLITENCSLKNLPTANCSIAPIFMTTDRVQNAEVFYESGAPRDQIKQHQFAVENIKLFDHFCNNLSLKSSCRRTIRGQLGLGIKEKVTNLNLPIALQDFLLLKDRIPSKCFSLFGLFERDDSDSDFKEWYE